MSKLAKALSAAAGNAGDANLYPEDVFSTYLYEGTGSAININNGLDLSGEGGLTWLKSRSLSEVNILMDTVRGVQSALVSNNANNVFTLTGGITAFNSNGFTLGTSNIINTNNSTNTSWSFRKAAGFFDVVTFTGNDTARTIAHNLGSVPKMIIVKSISDDYDWVVYHASLTNQQNLNLNTTSQAGNSGAEYWNSTTPTSSVFSLGTQFRVNGNSKTYVAYLFGDDAIFGDDGDEQICKFGSFTPTGSGTARQTINLGFEPQWLIIKNSTSTQSGSWWIFDNMRGFTAEDGSGSEYLLADDTGAASAFGGGSINITNQGFQMVNNAFVSSSQTFIYMAIRRPMKAPEVGTAVFAMDTLGSTGDGEEPGYRSPFPVDMGLKTALTGNQRQISTRLLQGTELLTESNAAEASSSAKQFDYMNGTDTSTATSTVNMMWMFKRASKFMDAVAYTGAAQSTLNVTHNLTVTPEMMIVKRRNSTSEWYVYHSATGNTKGNYLNYNYPPDTGNQFWNNTSPTATQFTVGDSLIQNGTWIAYLFATLAGISKVGSYSGNAGYAVNVDCGFSNGARFILIKSSGAGDWYVYDSLRGIVAGNDPYFFLNSTAAQVTNTDYIDPLASGFTVTSSAPAGLNASGVTYLFLAIA